MSHGVSKTILSFVGFMWAVETCWRTGRLFFRA